MELIVAEFVTTRLLDDVLLKDGVIICAAGDDRLPATCRDWVEIPCEIVTFEAAKLFPIKFGVLI